MASLEQRNGRFRVVFRYGGQKYTRSLRTRNEKAAEASIARLEDNLRRLELGTLVVPDDADVAAFLLSDGELKARRQAPKIRTLKKLCEAYFASVPPGSLEETTLNGMRTHVRHLEHVLGGNFPFMTIQLSDLQRYVDQRGQVKGARSGTTSPATIRKEVRTLTSIWNWAINAGQILRPLPKKGLRYPKEKEKPAFQTWAEISRKIQRGGLSAEDQQELWDSLFLTLPEVEECLAYVETAARQPFIYPMFVFAAHTGARRSEMIRSRIDDIDLEGRTVTIREKKRVRGRFTTRSVPLSPLLHRVLDAWLANHPGGQFTFSLGLNVQYSTKFRPGYDGVTPDEASDHFTRTLAGSEWEKLRGWHVFRHSFCSNCAAAGVDQRIINAWVGHQTEEMVKRYRHLIPNQQQDAIRKVFSQSA